jgi:hypothetical protein
MIAVWRRASEDAIMKSTVRIVIASAWLVAVLALAPSPSWATRIYSWEGICSFGCTGTAKGILTLVAGNPFNFDAGTPPSHLLSDFISFQYTSSNGTHFLDNSPPGLYAQGYTQGGSIAFLESDEFGPQAAGTPLFQFVVDNGLSGSSWQMLVGRYGDICLNADCSINTYDVRDGGSVSYFALNSRSGSTPPLPAALPLFATGLGVLGLLGWRKKRGNAVGSQRNVCETSV